MTESTLDAVYVYFRSRGEDPQVYAPGFFAYHLKHGLSASEIYRIACGREYLK